MGRMTWRRVRKGLAGLPGRIAHGYPIAFNRDKQRLIDRAFATLPVAPRSSADLGGVWGIDAAYTFYMLRRGLVERAVLVDTHISGKVRRRAGGCPGLELIEANFGDAGVPARIGTAGVVLLFDVLLHQVRPDWHEIIDLYAPVTRCFLVFNQQFVGGEATVRLVDLGVEEYFRHVRFDRTSPGYRELVERPDAIHPEHGRPYRDVHHIWQWGITDADLVAAFARRGYRLVHQAGHGRFGDFPSFENHSFIFWRE